MGVFDFNVYGMPGFRIKNYNFANVYVSHKTINSVRHGACSQKFGGVQIFYWQPYEGAGVRTSPSDTIRRGDTNMTKLISSLISATE